MEIAPTSSLQHFTHDKHTHHEQAMDIPMQMYKKNVSSLKQGPFTVVYKLACLINHRGSLHCSHIYLCTTQQQFSST